MPKNANADEIAAHQAERAFYDMTGDKNIYDYITTEGKRVGKLTSLEYLQKNTGVFNDKGILSEQVIDEMKTRIKENKGNIWHGFISLSEEDSYKIDTQEKCIALIKKTFPSFLTDAKLNLDNIDLMCALHLDRPKHLHIHFVFWEKEPKFKDNNGELQYRRKGKIDKNAIDNMFVRLGLCIDDKKDVLYKTRDAAYKELKELLNIKKVMVSSDEIRNKLVSLAKIIPETGRVSYGSKDMEPYHEKVDDLVQLLLSYDKQAREADKHFHIALEERRRAIKNICNQPYAFSDKNVKDDDMLRDLPKYHYTIDDSKIKIIEKIEEDYKRRQGNLVLSLAKFIKPEYYERKEGKKYKANDNRMKRSIAVSTRKIDSLFKRFLSTFGRESEMLERDYTHRLHDIEREIEQKNAQMEGEYKA